MKKYTDTTKKSYLSRKKRVQRVLRERVLKMKIKKGDTVIVTTGKDKGKTGEVTRVIPNLNKVVIDGVGIVKRSLKKTGRGQSGRIIERPMPVHASNVMVLDPESKKGTRVGRQMNKEGKRVRIAKKSGTVLK